MPRKASPVLKVGTKDWEVVIPRPPKRATHARMECFNYCYDNGTPKVATLLIQDFGCFKGVAGEFQFVRLDKKGKVLEEYPPKWGWDGNEVEGLPVV